MQSARRNAFTHMAVAVAMASASLTTGLTSTCFGGATPPLGASMTWTGLGASNNWIDVNNWTDPSHHPAGAGSAATINNGGNVGLDGLNITVDSLSLNGASLSGTGSLTSSISMSFTTGNTLGLTTLRNLGTAIWFGGNITTNFGPTFINAGTFDIRADASLQPFFFPEGLMQNSGLINKTAGTGSTLLQINLNNTGTVRAGIGTLEIKTVAATPLLSSGTFISDGGTLVFSNNGFGTGANFRGTGVTILRESNIIGPGVSIATGGTVRVDGANNNFGGTITLSAGSTLNLANGGEMRGNGRIQGAGQFRWTAGTLTGAASRDGTDLTNFAPMLITGPDVKTFAEGRFTNAGSAVWDDGNITTNNAGVFTNAGTMDLRSDNSMGFFFFGPAQLRNTGTWKKTAGTGESALQIDLQNTGTVMASSGTMRFTGLSAASSSNGTFISNGSGALQINGQTLTNGANFGGTGSSQFGADNSVSGAVSIAGGSAVRVIGPNNTVNGTISIASGGVLELTASSTTGELRGNGRIDGAGQFKWTAGTITGATGAGSDSLTSTAPMLITGPAGKTLADGRFTNAGSAVWNDGNITTNGQAVFNNTGTMDLQSDNSMGFFFFGPATLRNSGTWKKAAGAGLSPMQIDLQNTGTVLASSGTLRFTGTSVASTSNGTFISNGSGIVQLNDQTLTTGANFRGTGTSELQGGNSLVGLVSVAANSALRVTSQGNSFSGTIAIGAGGTLHLASGASLSGDGRIDGAGNLIFTGGTLTGPTSAGTSQLTIAAPTRITASATFGGGRITNTDSLTWLGGGITTNFGPQITNAGTFDLRSDDTLGMFFAPPAQIDNTGLFTKTAGAGQSTIGANFNSTGTGHVRVDSGTINFAQDFASTGTLTVAAGAGVQFNGANTTIGGSQHWPAGFALNTAGNTTFLTDAGAFGRNLSIANNGGTLTLASNQHLTGLNVQAHTTVAPSGASLLSTGTLSFGVFPTLDLTDNDMIVNSTTYDAIADKIRTARNGGAWDGFGITSSTAAAANPKNKTLGVLTGQQYRGVFGVGATFDGEPVAAADTLVKFTYYGDTDLNGVINFDDYSRTDAGFNTGATDWFHGDFDYNGVINFDDYSLIDLAFNTQSGTLRRAMSYLDGGDRSQDGMNTPSLQIVADHFQQYGNAYATSFLNAVPEPSSMLLATVAVNGLLLRRRRVI